MKTIIAITLIIVGIMVFAYQGIQYISREKIVDVGPVEITADKTITFPLPPVAGGLVFVGGILLLVVFGRKQEDLITGKAPMIIIGTRFERSYINHL
jgi:hypothetical protein